MTNLPLSIRCILLSFSLVFFTSTALLCAYILSVDECHCPQHAEALVSSKEKEPATGSTLSHKLAILVPFRDRFDELLAFAPHMEKFLKRQNIDHHFFILNQVDELRFNRASLINVGFKQTSQSFDYFVIHDVDLLPLRDELNYGYPDRGVFHVSSPEFHPKYHYPTFLGGILIVKREDFEKVNGMSNRYWGWGLEDDEFYTRLKDAQIEIRRPTSFPTNTTNTFLHTHQRERRRRDTRKCFNQVAVTRRRDRVTGLHDVRHRVLASVPLVIDGVPLTVLNVALECDHVLTPWCQCDKPPLPQPAKPSSTTPKASPRTD